MASYLGAGTKAGKMVYPEDIECVVDPTNGIGGIFIGNLEASQNLLTLKRHGIKAVLTAASGAMLSHPRTEVPLYKYIPGEDHERFDISQYFQECIQFIHEALQQTNILVHCMAGVSRSVSLVLAYLIKHKNLGYDAAYSHVKARRKIIHPNDGFIDQLRKFEREVKRDSPPKNRYESPFRKNESPIKRFSDYESPSKRREELFSTTAYLESSSRLAVSPSKQYAASPSRRTYESPLKNYESPLKHSEAFERSGLAATLNPERRTLKEYMNESRIDPSMLPGNPRLFMPPGTSATLTKHSVSVSHYRGKSEVENRQQPQSDLDKKIADIRKKYSDLSENVKTRFAEDDSSINTTAYRPSGPPLRHMKSMNYDHMQDYPSPSPSFLKTQMDNFIPPSVPETPAPRIPLRRQTTMYQRAGYGGNYPAGTDRY